MARAQANIDEVTRQSETVVASANGFNPHLAYFDADGDDHISLGETFIGLKRIGFGYGMSLPATAMIHLGVAGLGLVRGQPQNPLHLAMPSVGRLRHPDTAIVDTRDRFDIEQLEAVFRQYGQRYAGDALTMAELTAMATARLFQAVKARHELLLLPVGIGGTILEWGALAWFCGEKRDGQQVLSREAVRRFYTDARFFDDIAARVERQRKTRGRSLVGRLRNALQTWLL
jgi:hypothetical protein